MTDHSDKKLEGPKRQVMQKHFVTFLSPGTFFVETSTKPIADWNTEKAQEMAEGMTERYGAIPFGFYFTTRERGDADLDSKESRRSPMYYLPHCYVETLAEVKKRNDPREKILVSNMETNGYPEIVTTSKGWKFTQPLGKDDVLLKPLQNRRACQ